jgi:hypothetical protein
MSNIVITVDARSVPLLFLSSGVFLKKMGSGTHSEPKFDRRGRAVNYIDSRKKIPNAVLKQQYYQKKCGSYQHIREAVMAGL